MDDTTLLQTRNLTPAEIEAIVTKLPISYKFHRFAKEARQGILFSLREQLKEIEAEEKYIPRLIQDLTTELIKQYEKSLVTPGEAVGVLSSQALMAPLTQSNFNTHRSAGGGTRVTSSIDRFNELIQATEIPANPTYTLYFNQRVTVEDVILVLRPMLMEVNVSDLVKTKPSEQSNILYWDENNVPWWYYAYFTLINPQFQPSGWYLRLEVDTALMYDYGITMESLANSIKSGDDRHAIHVVPSPVELGLIDIHVDPNAAFSQRDAGAGSFHQDKIYLQVAILPSLDRIQARRVLELSKKAKAKVKVSTSVTSKSSASKHGIQIQGINGLKTLFPVESPLWSLVSEEKLVSVDDQIATWRLVLNQQVLRLRGIPLAYLEELLTHLQIEISQRETHPLDSSLTLAYLVKLNTQDPAFSATSQVHQRRPSSLVNYLVETEKTKRQAEQDRLSKEAGRLIYVEPSPAYQKAFFVYAEGDGGNLRQMLAHPLVDSNHSLTNNLREIYDVLGLEVARNYLVYELYSLAEMTGTSINPAHFQLIADYIVREGQVIPITFKGLSSKSSGDFTKITFQKPIAIIKNAAGFGSGESTSGTSFNILTGGRIPVGTGSFDLLNDLEEITNRQTATISKKPLPKLTASAGVKASNLIRQATSQLRPPILQQLNQTTGLNQMTLTTPTTGFNFNFKASSGWDYLQQRK